MSIAQDAAIVGRMAPHGQHRDQAHKHNHDHHHHLDHRSGGGQAADDELADMLDLDAEVLGSYLDDVTAWVAQRAPEAVHTVVDVGAGTGTGIRALARRFPAAEVVAIDSSDSMLERLRAAAHREGLTDRLRAVQADLDVAWPEVGAVDVAWAASSLHHIADPDRLLRDVHTALRPGGLLVVIEMDTPPRFLPEDFGHGRPGLEARCHEAMAQADWNAHPNWRPHLQKAGFEITGEHNFDIETDRETPGIDRYARAFLSRMRGGLDDRLAPDDLDCLDRLLDDDSPDALLRRGDLTVRASRTAWAARRPGPDPGGSA